MFILDVVMAFSPSDLVLAAACEFAGIEFSGQMTAQRIEARRG